MTTFSIKNQGNNHQLLAQYNLITPLIMSHSLRLRNNGFLILVLLTIFLVTKTLSTLTTPSTLSTVTLANESKTIVKGIGIRHPLPSISLKPVLFCT